jgi:hypothetical protein
MQATSTAAISPHRLLSDDRQTDTQPASFVNIAYKRLTPLLPALTAATHCHAQVISGCLTSSPAVWHKQTNIQLAYIQKAHQHLLPFSACSDSGIKMLCPSHQPRPHLIACWLCACQQPLAGTLGAVGSRALRSCAATQQQVVVGHRSVTCLRGCRCVQI